MTAFEWKTFFCLESHIHLCSRHTSAIPAYVIKTCLTWHAISGTRYWGFVSPKLHVSTYRNQQHCWWFHKVTLDQIKCWCRQQETISQTNDHHHWSRHTTLPNHSLLHRLIHTSGPWFNIKMLSYQDRKSHCGDTTVVRSSYLHNRVSYTGKMIYSYWIMAQDIWNYE